MSQKAFVIASLNWISCSNGFVFGQIAGMIGSLQKREEMLDLSDGQISLIASAMTMVCLIGFGLAAIVTDKCGRRTPYIYFCIPSIVNWIILYKATEMYQFMLSRIIAGASIGALASLNIFVTSEYTSPKTRAFYLNMVSTVAPAVGTSLAHAIGIVLHWRTVALIGIFPSALGIVLPYFWVESPHWLASKGKFQECEMAFRKLHATTINSERELELIIKMEKRKLKSANETNCKSTTKKLLVAFKRKYFWGLLILNIVLNAYFAAAGKSIFNLFASVMLAEITGTSDVLLFTLLVDGFIVLGSCLSCVLIRKTSMRTLLFLSGFIANVILVLFSACFYFKNGQSYFNWINVSLLAFYFIIVNAGPYPVVEALHSELFPLELKVYAFFIAGFSLIGFLTLSIFMLPYIVSSIGYHGLFLTNAAIMSICLGYIWSKLPETKGKTLQEIEMYFKANDFNIDEILNNEQSNVLI